MPTKKRAAKKGCEVKGCGRRHFARGLCNAHWERRRTGIRGVDPGRPIHKPCKPIEVGDHFGQLIVMARARANKPRPGRLWRERRWRCQCKCGKISVVRQSALRSGHTQSCGHTRRPPVPPSNADGLSHTSEYASWSAMIRRCGSSSYDRFHRYGGRGITVCYRWRNSLQAFLADVGPRPSRRHSIDRKDNDGGYWCGKCSQCKRNKWPPNCRWATPKQQQNNRSNNRTVSQ